MSLLAMASASQIVVITKFLTGEKNFYLCIGIDFYLFYFVYPIVLPKLQGSY